MVEVHGEFLKATAATRFQQLRQGSHLKDSSEKQALWTWAPYAKRDSVVKLRSQNHLEQCERRIALTSEIANLQRWSYQTRNMNTMNIVFISNVEQQILLSSIESRKCDLPAQ